MQWSALASNWSAFELPMDAEQTLYIVHRQKFLTFQWLAFLAVVLITSRKPFSAPLFLVVLLVLFEVVARSVPPCYIGVPSGAFLGVLVSFAFVLIRSQFVPSEVPPEYPPRHDSTECSAVGFVQTPLAMRTVLLCTVLAGLSTPIWAQILPEPTQDAPSKEPYRIIYPIDAMGQVVGKNVWLPKEFLDLLHQVITPEHPVTARRWSITKAVYQGSLIRGTSGNLECADDFKVLYDVYLDSSNATITLPSMPVVYGKFYWNARPIQPLLRDDVQNAPLSFLIENETPGKHTLEIALAPKTETRNDGETFQIAFPILKVPHSTLQLRVPPDVQSLSVPDARGAVMANTGISQVITADLGTAEQLLLAWVDDPSRNGVFTNDVEQFFWIKVEPKTIKLDTLFRYHIDGKLRHISIQTDPRWLISGQFQSEPPMTLRLVPSSELPMFDSLSALPQNVSHIEFPTSVSGIVAIKATFVPSGEFYGVRNLRLPQFTALQSRITKSMLAVSADSLFDLTCPTEGRDSGFEAGWLGTTTIIPFGDIPILSDITTPFFVGRNTAIPNSPVVDVAYDLTKTESDWTLNIQAKKPVPNVAVSQSVLFDANESKLRVVGNFTVPFDIFRQYLAVESGIQIESVEVRDAQEAIVESRLQPVASGRYCILFRNSVKEKFTISVRGFLEGSQIQDGHAQQPFAVPMVSFDEAQTTEYALNYFRTSSVLAVVAPSEESEWVKSSAIPTAPETFAQPIPLGTWRRVESPLPESLPDGSIVKSERKSPPKFDLRLNRPKVKCITILSLNADTDDQWNMTLDYTGDIADGELRSLRFRWDERCGTIKSIEPDARRSFETVGGQTTLVVTPTELMRDEQRFKITIPLNTSGAVSLPNVFPLAGIAEQFDSELWVTLPRKHENEIIPWELKQLEPIGEQDTNASRWHYRATDNDFAAAINQDEAKLTATFYDIGFLIRRDGTITGVLTIDFRNQGQGCFVLHMPQGYEPIQVSSAGLLLERIRLEESNRWQINIGTSDYPQRLNILFKASIPVSLKKWNREQITSSLQFPFLEGVAVQETLWTATFEGSIPTLNVETILGGGETNKLKEHSPLSGKEATLSLIGVNLIREHNLLYTLRSLPVSSRQEEMRRWLAHWLEEWYTVADKVDFQMTLLSAQDVKPKLLLRSNLPRRAEPGTIRAFLDTMGTSTQAALRVGTQQSVLEKFGISLDTAYRQPVPILTSQVYWQGRISAEMQHLFGAEEGALRAIHLTSMPSEGKWTDWLSEQMWVAICLLLLVPIVLLLSVRWVYMMELWLQFPHFWGMTIGVLLWVFLPESFLGLAIIVLTFASFFRPSWRRNRSMSKLF
jgi:hypothetical protein